MDSLKIPKEIQKNTFEKIPEFTNKKIYNEFKFKVNKEGCYIYDEIEDMNLIMMLSGKNSYDKKQYK